MRGVMANNWAIVVGINEYEFSSSLPPLRYADRDALAMRQFLYEKGGFEAENILICGNRAEEEIRKASRPVLRDILQKDIQRAHDADNLWFFFGGHGTVGNDKQDYLMTVDANPDDLEHTAISIHFVTDRLRACKAKNIVLILDMCRIESRDSGRRSVESSSLRELVKEREGQQGIITLFSCGRGESSYEIEKLRHGAFTYALLEGLQQHTILKDLEAYVARRVLELHQAYSTKQARKQVPLVISEPGWKYEEPILSNYSTSADVPKLKDLAQVAECDRDINKATRLWETIVLSSNANDSDRRLALAQFLRLKGQSPSPTAIESIPVITTSAKTPEPKQQLGLPPLKVIEFTSVKLDSSTGRIIDEPKPTAETFTEANFTQGDSFTENLGKGIKLDMVYIPAGEFWMGSSDEKFSEFLVQAQQDLKWNKKQTEDFLKVYDERPRHLVRITAGYMSKYQITQSQYKLLMNGDNPSTFSELKNLPVDSVSWDDAIAFCNKLGKKTEKKYTLPSEAQWEYACRARSETPFNFGEIISPSMANYNCNYKYGADSTGKYLYPRRTKPVGTCGQPNQFGLFDMHGNLSEWCLDSWHKTYNEAPLDGSAWMDSGEENHIQEHILRGGSWNKAPRDCRSASRDRSRANVHHNCYGFRVWLSI
jgi:formylglycine-generating enzyme required for sulfatase activity